jgi:hypothetical protein
VAAAAKFGSGSFFVTTSTLAAGSESSSHFALFLTYNDPFGVRNSRRQMSTLSTVQGAFILSHIGFSGEVDADAPTL